MALKIRLTKVGSVHQPLYRVVVAEARSRRDGAAVENLGTYRPGDKGSPINVNLERVDYWLSKGARPTNTMHAMIKKARRSAAAKRPIIRRAMFVRRPSPQVMHVHGEMTCGNPLPENALGQKAIEHSRKKGQDIDRQRHEMKG